jgi:hypothetical protein
MQPSCVCLDKVKRVISVVLIHRDPKQLNLKMTRFKLVSADITATSTFVKILSGSSSHYTNK